MKKVFCLITAFLMIVLSSCNDNVNTPSETENDMTENIVVTTDSVTKKSDETVKREPFPPIDITKAGAVQKYFIGTSDKDAVSYSVGENVKFTVKLYAGDRAAYCSKFKWTLKADDGTASQGYVDGSEGVMELNTTITKAGFIHLKVEACDNNNTPIPGVEIFDGGAGAGISQITKTKAEPSDFDALWATQLARLDNVTPELLECVEVTSSNAGFSVYKVKIKFFEGTHGNYVSGYLTVPKGAKAGTLGLKLTYRGYGVSDLTPVVYNTGCATLMVAAHSMELGRESSYYTSLAPNKNNYGFNSTYNANRDTVYFKEMILRDVQAVRFMKKYLAQTGSDSRFAGLWNEQTKKISLSGTSQGGFQAVAVAALEKSVTDIDVAMVWMCDIGGYGVNGRQRSTYMPTYTAVLEYYDSVNFGKRITCSVNISVSGLGDYVANPAGITALYNAITSQKGITLAEQNSFIL